METIVSGHRIPPVIAGERRVRRCQRRHANEAGKASGDHRDLRPERARNRAGLEITKARAAGVYHDEDTMKQTAQRIRSRNLKDREAEDSADHVRGTRE